MYIKNLRLSDFMVFDSLDVSFSKNINIISGENSTGKTVMLKILYSALRGISDTQKIKGNFTKEAFEANLVKKILGVFRPDDAVGRLVNRTQGRRKADIFIATDNGCVSFDFSSEKVNHINVSYENIDHAENVSTAFIPPKEIISSTSNFASLYDEYHIDFEETYYDLARLLEKPLRKGPNTKEQKKLIKSFEDIINGNVVQENRKFYLKIKGEGEFEMSLVSEGYRKLSTIIYLILSGSLSSNSVLFWDEPEINMNPKMIMPIAEAMLTLAKLGVQIFIATHDYFVQQCFNLVASYPKANKDALDIKFISLYRQNNETGKSVIQYEVAKSLAELSHNTIMEEFDYLYDREQGLI